MPLRNIDWPLFAKQKQYLVDLANAAAERGDGEGVELLDGVINLMDAIQDAEKPNEQ